MKAGDFAAMLASKVAFPALSAFAPRAQFDGGSEGLRVYASPNGHKLLYRPGSMYKLVLWEQWLMKDYQGLAIKPGDIVVEFGGHIGTSALSYAQQVGPTGTVYSVEALPENFRILNENVRRNGAGNVKTFNLAIVGDTAIDRIELNTNPFNSGGHSVLQLPVEAADVTVCPAMTLERFVAEQNIARIDILQMDIEGAEFDILLNGDRDLLASIPQIMFEYHDAFASGHRHGELVELLRGLGFQTREYRNFISKAFNLETGIITARK